VSGEGSSGAKGSGGRSLPMAPQQAEIRSWRLLVTLGAAGALAGLLIVFVYQGTQPRIQAYKAMMLRLAVSEVLKAPDHWDTLYVSEGGLTPTPPAEADVGNLEMVFIGHREDGSRVGFAITGGEAGFQDVIDLIFGYDPETRTVLGMKVLSSRETLGLGDKIEHDSAFVAEFEGPEVPLVGVKSGRATGAANEVDMITGATISSRAVISIINHRLERLGPMLEAFIEERS